MIWTPDYENHRRENETQNQAEEKRLDPVEGKDLGVEPKDACQVEGAGNESEKADHVLRGRMFHLFPPAKISNPFSKP